MRERHHLGALQVGVSGHRRGSMLGGAGQQRLLHTCKFDQEIGARAPCPHAQIGCDLVVAASPGVEHACDRSGELEQPALHRCVDVLVARRRRKDIAGEFGGDGAQSRVDCAMLRDGEHADAAQHARVGA